MVERGGKRKFDKKEGLRPFYNEETIRRYLMMKRLATEAQRNIRQLAGEWGSEYAGIEGIRAIKEICGLFIEDEEGGEQKETSRALEKRAGLTPREVVDLVYDDLAKSGKFLKKFGIIFKIVIDKDWHRTDICYLGGNGMVIEAANGKRIALARVNAKGDKFLTSLSGGLVYVELKERDPMTGKKGLNRIFEQKFYQEGRGLLIAEGALFLDGVELPRRLAGKVEEHGEIYRGEGRLSNVYFVSDGETEIPPNVRPVVTISGYKKEAIPYLIKEIKRKLGIGEPQELTPPNQE